MVHNGLPGTPAASSCATTSATLCWPAQASMAAASSPSCARRSSSVAKRASCAKPGTPINAASVANSLLLSTASAKCPSRARYTPNGAEKECRLPLRRALSPVNR